MIEWNTHLTPAPEPDGPLDPNDIFVGSVISRDTHDYHKATHVLIGCPQDIGVQRNHGRPGAAEAPATIRNILYKLKPPRNLGSGSVLDLGDIITGNNLEAIHDTLHAVVRQAVADGKHVMVMGGGNDCSLPDAKAVHATHPDFAAINMDAHLDMRISDQVHSGTPYRNLIEGGFLTPENFHEVGIQPWANSPIYLEKAEELGVNIHTYLDIRTQGKTSFFNGLFSTLKDKLLFAGLDMDSVRASHAPGVSASSPIGFSANDVINFAARCREHGRTAVFEITEVNPAFDIDGRTARLAAQALYTFAYGIY
ncbi:formimidoylglutamase [uncultured Pseudodesulfovibrio sp.]|uniref:formimidoylglutamase n=1 Tax=uncultured Pseudodesulfovibrio sp. TaxID=2035858 RepID=UPI0029C7F283|nr:formimidoylglutamase [uncultured Pseudodesulfovibrio sp.]